MVWKTRVQQLIYRRTPRLFQTFHNRLHLVRIRTPPGVLATATPNVSSATVGYIGEKHPPISENYIVSQKKNSQNCFCHNFVKFPPTLIFFGKTRAKMIELCEVYLFTTSPNLCQRTTVCNTDAPNCYITTWLFVSDFLHLHHQFNRGCHVIY